MDDSQLEIWSKLQESAQLYVQGLDPKSKHFVIHEMSRHSYEKATFLGRDPQAESDLFYVLPLEETLRKSSSSSIAKKPVHFIFHFALCGSTLLSRCLDHPGHTMVYREPYLLHQASYYLRFPQFYPGLPAEKLLHFALGNLQKTCGATEIPIVKPTDSCSNIVEDCLHYHPYARGLILYNTLDDFLLSVLKSKQRRTFMRGMKIRADDDLHSLGIHPEADENELSDAEVSGYVWFSLMSKYEKLLEQSGIALKSLRQSDLVRQPIKSLKAISNYFQLNLPRALIEKTVESGNFTRDAKVPEVPFDQLAYKTQLDSERSRWHEEIEAGKQWVYKVCEDFPLPSVLPCPLLDEEK